MIFYAIEFKKKIIRQFFDTRTHIRKKGANKLFNERLTLARICRRMLRRIAVHTTRFHHKNKTGEEMKRIAIPGAAGALAFCAITNSAHASYTEEAKKLEMCRTVAELAERGYQDRGHPVEMNKPDYDSRSEARTHAHRANDLVCRRRRAARRVDEGNVVFAGSVLIHRFEIDVRTLGQRVHGLEVN
jgi:lactam utilization protein B